ncbi:hypothetical protein KFL_001090300 [Klebsormidium nitens]|uniref:PPPDE domain-containing protein n=1 Tax=Klebsormidium nitens TaxID=105231 RepID=A0A1Y1HW40_KLENI|nr:hypothetical protein KFL_001090300 [Klebsormidium nitens]|eukprot:GAQ82383.1 hypothetical protein KFL_001090300 [Klebsormidium nitens]
MEHAMTLVEGPDGKCVCFDFRPVDPESPSVCFTLLTGRTSPGILRQSRLSRLPRKNCWLVGESKRSIEEAVDFHNKWDSRLHLVRNNCYTHTDALVEHLTGQPRILETLQLGAQKRLVEVFALKERKQA